MQDEHTYTNEQLHQAFHNYLMEKFDGVDVEVSSYIETAERIIPNTLNDYFGTHYESVYELQDSNVVENFQKKIKAHPILKGIDMSEEPRYTEVLKWYKLFVKALNTDSIPIPVPGEYPVTEDEHPGIAAEPSPENIIREGDKVQKSHDEEIFKRDPKLRTRYISYLKTKTGRVCCECCGFDFEKAYGDIGEDYVEVHHKNPFSQTSEEAGGTHDVKLESDLIALCSNCHSMIHAVPGRGTCMTPEDLMKRINFSINYNN